MALSDLETTINRKYGESPSGIARQYGLDTDVVLSLIQTESGGNARAVGPKNYTGEQARGLMQVMPKTAAPYGVTADELFDPFTSLNTGMKYLDTQIKKFGNVYDGLRAYNAGPGAASVDDSAGADYAAKILRDAGKGSLIPGNAVLSDEPATFLDTLKDKVNLSNISIHWPWLQEQIDKLKSYGISAVVWVAITVLVLFSVYQLVAAKAVAPAAA